MNEPVDVAEVREQHVESRTRKFECECCGCDWPCDAIRLCDALEESERQAAWLRRELEDEIDDERER